VQRKKAVRIMREAISDRLNDITKDAIVLIMQRLHQATAPRRRRRWATSTSSCRWSSRPSGAAPPSCGRPTTATRPSCSRIRAPTEGELLFPERFPAAEVAQLKRDKGSYAWAGQYQQRPAPRDGGIFQRAWFQARRT
jgi:hypothetical protein